ncbi:GNAT family N-acetyltransferase [Streptomyces sp. NPDC057617]|uniref:GNAT family N-acetyltransferase n=1 Tax=Streptomyces sp. NPDC057617 TaxID=3346184 RepID=UPI00367E0964
MANDSSGSSLRIRPATPDDATNVAEALVRNRDHMRPWEPYRPDEFFTPQTQARWLADPSVRRWFAADGTRIVGEVNLSSVSLGAFRSAVLGYWIDAEYTGRGLATRAVQEVCRAARDELGLHRIEAGTMLANAASQRVLRKCGFELIGTAPRYLHIDGEWRDHHLFQRILHNSPPGVAP